MKPWFSSDPHWGHYNIIRYSCRPFSSVEEMNEALIKNFNSKVGPKDHLYLLGDLFFMRYDRAIEILKRLNGKKFLVLGNHDGMIRKKRSLFEPFFEFIGDDLEIKIQDPDAPNGKSQKIIMHHYAKRVWNDSHKGSWNLYGHSHGSLPDDPNALQMDVGVDCNNYFPFSYEEVKAFMKQKKYRPVDHHR